MNRKLFFNFWKFSTFGPTLAQKQPIFVYFIGIPVRSDISESVRVRNPKFGMKIDFKHISRPFFSFSKFLIFYPENGFLNTGVFPSWRMKPLLSLKDVTWYIWWLSKCLLVTYLQILWSARLTNTGSSFQFFVKTQKKTKTFQKKNRKN